MITAMLLLASATSVPAVSTPSGTPAVEHVRIEVSDGAVSTIRLPRGQQVVDATLQDPSQVEVGVVSGRTIALRGAPDARGVHMLVRRTVGAPLDVLLVPGAEASRSSVTDVGGVSSKVAQWRLDGRNVSMLKPGFAIASAVRTPGIDMEALPSDGTLVATKRTDAGGDVVVYGADGEVGIYRLD